VGQDLAPPAFGLVKAIRPARVEPRGLPQAHESLAAPQPDQRLGAGRGVQQARGVRAGGRPESQARGVNHHGVQP
jgi:hypothetical protein